jgi:exonuclease SbcC
VRFERLWLKAYGPFEDQTLDFTNSAGLQLVYGPNEAGKSSALRAITALLFGIPGQTRDNFRHEYNQLRIGAVFCGEDHRRMAVMRRKGTKATLFECDPQSGQEYADRPLPIDYFSQLLGNLDQDTFLNLFGIDHARLRAGGKELLEGRGEIGQTLFQAASGLAGVSKLLAELNKNAGDLFTPRSQKPSLNVAIRQYDDAHKRLKDALVRPREWKDREKALNQAQAKVRDLEEQIGMLRAEEKLLTRLLATIPLIVKLETFRNELRELSGTALLAEDAVKRRIAAESAIEHSGKEITEAKALIEDYQEELVDLHISEALLASGPDIETLRHDLSRAADASGKILQSQALLAGCQKLIDEIVARLGPGHDPRNITGSFPDRTDVARVRELIGQLSTAGVTRSNLRQRVNDLVEELASAQAELNKLPIAPDLSTLSVTVETLNRQGDLEAQVAAIESELLELTRKLSEDAQALGINNAEDLRCLQVPLDSEVEEYRHEFDRHEDAITNFDHEERALQRDLNAVTAEMSGLEASGSIITADKVEDARRLRDEHWFLIRRTFIERESDADKAAVASLPRGDLPDAFEQSVKDADTLADELRSDTARATKYAALMKRVEQMHERLQSIEEERQTICRAAEQCRTAWHARISGLGLNPMSPEVFKEWLAERRRVLQRVEQVERCLAQKGIAEVALARARESLEKACREVDLLEPIATPSLTMALALAAKVVADGQTTHNQREVAQREVSRLERELQLTRSKLEEAEEQESELRTQWQSAVAKLYLSRAATPAEAEVRIEDLNQLREALINRERFNNEIATEQLFLEQHQSRATRIAFALDLPAPLPGQVGTFVEQRYVELGNCRLAAQRKLNLEEALRKEQQRLTRSLAERDAAETELNRLVAAAGCVEAKHLPEAEARSDRRREITVKVQEIEEQLVTQWRAPLDSLVAEAEAKSVDAVETRLAEVHRNLLELDPQLTEARELASGARRNFLAIDGEARAADIKEEMECILARIRRDAERYARIRLALVLLERSIQRFREKAHGPLLAKAQNYFSLMTGGNYRELHIDFVDDQQVLVASRSDGACLHVSEMSEGTVDQLYLALRLGAIEMNLENGYSIPIILDDVLLAFDDQRAGYAIAALAKLANKTQVLLFTHHRHIVQIAESCLPAGSFGFIGLKSIEI